MNKRREASFISAVCGFPKDFSRGRIRKGQFGDDAWFSAKFKTVEVIGNVSLLITSISNQAYYCNVFMRY